MQRLYETLFYSKAVNEIYTNESIIKYMLQFESALAKAQATQGVIPVSAAATIVSCCKIENISIEPLIEQAALGGNINIPFVKQLTEVVTKTDAEAGKYVHFGATSQDVIDTATILQLKAAHTLIVHDLDVLIATLTKIIKEHRRTLMVGRSFMQHARPITFGFKVACWLDGLLRSKKRLSKIMAENLVLQLGGAVGTLSGMPGKGLATAEAMCSALELTMPRIPWHTQRDRIAEIATTLGILTGSLRKIAKDISLLMQTEIAEVFESRESGKGGSSTMPHKRNPVGCISILANSARVPALVSTMISAMEQDHERGTGSWHSEWETLTDIVQLTAGATHNACLVINGLQVDKEKMRSNIELTKGLIYAENISLALAEHLGKATAHLLLETLCEQAIMQKVHLKMLVQKNETVVKHLSQDQIDALFNPENSIGMCDTWIDRVLDA